MSKLIDPSPLVKALQLQLLLERDRSMRDCDQALALRFVDRMKRETREQAREAEPEAEAAA